MEKSWCSTRRPNECFALAGDPAERAGAPKSAMHSTGNPVRGAVCSAWIIVVLLATAGNAPCEHWWAWPGDFLRMGAGARAMAMGNAYSAVDGDVFSSYYNPAGLASIGGRQIGLSYRYMSMDRYFTHLAFAGRIGPDAGFAFSWIGAGTDGIQGRDLNGNPTGNLKDSRNSFGVTFSKSIGSRLSVGVTPKLTLWKLAGEDAKAFGADIGVLVRPLESLSAAFVLRDMNSRFTWDSGRWSDTISGADGQPMEKDDKFPLCYTIGLAWKPLGDRFVLCAMTESVQDNPTGYDFGASWAYNRILTLRAGVYNYTTTDGLDYGSITAGFGLRVTGTIGFDYTFASDSIENDRLHLVSLVLTYGE